jgi:uncharacterized protein (TIGR02996 family)
MTDLEAMCRAVCRHPEDNTARLVLADCLEEADQAVLASSIRMGPVVSLEIYGGGGDGGGGDGGYGGDGDGGGMVV